MARRPAPLPDSYDPLDVALDAERGDPAPDSPARALLLKHNALAEADLKHRRLQIVSERAGLALRLLTSAAGLAAAAVLGTMAWQAHNAKGLVMDPFSTPPDLAAKGYTGQAVAARFLDRLRDLQARTDSARAPSSYGNDWASGFKVEIPGSGISIDELQRFLRGWLGHETHVSGELTRTATGLQLSVRAGDEVGRIYSVSGDDLDGLMQQAALDLYKQQQPYRYAIYLAITGKMDESEEALRDLAFNGGPEDQYFALAGLANTLCGDRHDCRTALTLARRAHELRPAAAKPWWNIRDAQSALSHPEEAMAAVRVVMAQGKDANVTQVAYEHVRLNGPATVAELLEDYPRAAGLLEREARLPDYSGNRLGAMLGRVMNLHLGHDPAAAASAEALYGPLVAKPDVQYPLRFAAAYGLEDWRALAAMSPLGPDSGALFVNGVLARARARIGDIAGAEDITAPMPDDCYDCLMAKGEIASLKGDQAAAERRFSQAVRLAPSVPTAYRLWADARMRAGDAAGAVVLMTQATVKGPRSADAWSGLGRALLATGDAAGAETALRKAAALAPHWGRNQVLLGEALKRQGRAAEAQAVWRGAQGLQMTAGDRARLDYLLKGGR